MIIKKLFNKEIDDLDLEDMENYFKQPREESDIIEYKSYFIKNQNNHKEKEKAILKTICGFLNSNGGIIIWGAPKEQKTKEGTKFYEGTLSPVEKLIEKDNFISKTINRITPIASNIQAKSIPINKDSCILVVSVGESNYKPHRFDGRYWMRSDGQTNVSPHHLVEAQFKQIRYPNLEGYLKINSISKNQFLQPIGFKTKYDYLWVEVEFYIFNYSGLINEENIAISLISHCGKFGNYKMPSFSQNHKVEGHMYFNDNAKEVLYYGEPLMETHKIIIDPIELQQKNNEFEIWLSFGGKKSPQKRSTYKFNLKNWNVTDYNALIVEIEENKLSVEMALDTGASKSDLLKELIGR